MFRTFTTVAAVATASVVSITPALPAAASTTTSTMFVDFARSAGPVAYQQPVTFTGELIQAVSKAPVAGEPVQIKFKPVGQTQYVPVATGTTASDGHFTISATLPGGGYATAAFAGDTGLGAAATPGAGILLNVTNLPSRIALDPVPASVPAGTPVTFSGTMQVQVNGAWEAFAGSPLTLTTEPGTSSQPPRTYPTTSGADGRFSLTEPVSETGTWSIANTLDGLYRTEWFPEYASASYNLIDGVSETRVTDFSVPAHDEAHHAYSSGMYATGTVERWNGTAWVGLPDGRVDFYYRPSGSTTWTKDVAAQTDAYGHFNNVLGVHLGTANWQVRVRPAADTLASTSTGTVTNTITDQTHFASASISRKSSGSTISGKVTDYTSGQVSFSSLHGLKVHLYYRAKSAKTWTDYRTATLGTTGTFTFSVPKNSGYSFEVVFPTQGAYQTSTSRTL